jgi:hypothetical protein
VTLSAVVLGRLLIKIGSSLPINKTRNLLSANFTEHTGADSQVNFMSGILNFKNARAI